MRAGLGVCGWRRSGEASGRQRENGAWLPSLSMSMLLEGWRGWNQYWHRRSEVQKNVLENWTAPNEAKFPGLNKLHTWAWRQVANKITGMLMVELCGIQWYWKSENCQRESWFCILEEDGTSVTENANQKSLKKHSGGRSQRDDIKNLHAEGLLP